jgi:hypoxanthine phosphoribosyltransferase
MSALEGRLEKIDSKTPEIIKPRVNLNLKETEYDNDIFICPSWEQMGEFTSVLGKKINSSAKSFDRMVVLAKGGLTWSRALADFIKVDKISTTRFKAYHGVNQSGEPQIIQPLTDSVVGEDLLLFDEVIDSGATIKKALKYLKIMGANSIQTAALCYKPRSTDKPDHLRPNYYAFKTNAWVCFPHETRETIEGLTLKWQVKGVPNDEIKQRLVEIGLPPNEVEDYSIPKLNQIVDLFVI